MTRIAFLDEAEEEILEASAYCEAQAAGLGHASLDEIDDALERIGKFPAAGQIVRGRLRRHLLRRFPYALLYRTDPERILILAVMHLRRKPGYWQARLEP